MSCPSTGSTFGLGMARGLLFRAVLVQLAGQPHRLMPAQARSMLFELVVHGDVVRAALLRSAWLGIGEGLHQILVLVAMLAGSLGYQASHADASTGKEWSPLTERGARCRCLGPRRRRSRPRHRPRLGVGKGRAEGGGVPRLRGGVREGGGESREARAKG